jgi:hypothetical protein
MGDVQPIRSMLDLELPESEVVEVKVKHGVLRYRVRELTQAEAEKALAKDGEGSITQKLLAAAVEREDGTRLTIADVASLRASIARQLVEHVLRVNGLGEVVEGN